MTKLKTTSIKEILKTSLGTILIEGMTSEETPILEMKIEEDLSIHFSLEPPQIAYFEKYYCWEPLDRGLAAIYKVEI